MTPEPPVKSALIIINPVSPNLPSRRHLREAVAWLKAQGWRAGWVYTRWPGEATQIAGRAAGEERDLLVVCGGDGTISEAINGLAGSFTPLAVIPAGTANVWAKEVGLPRRPTDALRVALHGQPQRMDLGVAGAGEDRRYFFLMAGVGLDGQIAASLPLGVKRYLGATAYAITAVRESLRFRGQQVRLLLDGEPCDTRLMMMVVGNTRNYGGITQVTARACANDGLLDVCLFPGDSPLDIIVHTLRVIARAHLRAGSVLYRRVRRVELPEESAFPVQLDGDFCPTYPTVFEVAPAALTVMLPRRHGTGLPLFRPQRRP
jgi:YegS/Rv2252/BmrU family lipid kinase